MLSLKKIKNRNIKGEVYLPVSKSILNRNLIIKALNQTLTAEDVQEGSTDVQLLYKALTQTEGEVDFKDAGTPLRLYIAYAALKGIELSITGNERLKERPIQPLLKALEQLGAEFQFLENPYQFNVNFWDADFPQQHPDLFNLIRDVEKIPKPDPWYRKCVRFILDMSARKILNFLLYMAGIKK
jgi:3-phosphoshikimate 1-carboxyvinyltransferase